MLETGRRPALLLYLSHEIEIDLYPLPHIHHRPAFFIVFGKFQTVEGPDYRRAEQSHNLAQVDCDDEALPGRNWAF